MPPLSTLKIPGNCNRCVSSLLERQITTALPGLVFSPLRHCTDGASMLDFLTLFTTLAMVKLGETNCKWGDIDSKFVILKMQDPRVFLFFVLLLVSTCEMASGVLTLKVHHRFSETMKSWSEDKRPITTGDFPSKKSVDYYTQLADIDAISYRRKLLDSGDYRVSFSDGNSTFRLEFLHYTTVSLGTPEQKFMVALDTGSDLFWVPCDCKRCAPIDNTASNSDFKRSIYNSARSSTYRNVSCKHGRKSFDSCPYSLSYLSNQTSTSGILMEDLLHLETEDNDNEVIDAFVTFGCGQVQSGLLLEIDAPNGIFGLGFQEYSVPTILDRLGYITNSFSLCFGLDGDGTISFGDKGSSLQSFTPFNIDRRYNITVTELRVGMSLTHLFFTALFDTGSSFTYLTDPYYAAFTEEFDAQIKDSRLPPDPSIPFKYCYETNPDAKSSIIPSMTLTMEGGGLFYIHDPIITFDTKREFVYCLAVMRSEELNIIGQNFMMGYRLVFNREELVLGWEPSDCGKKSMNLGGTRIIGGKSVEYEIYEQKFCCYWTRTLFWVFILVVVLIYSCMINA